MGHYASDYWAEGGGKAGQGPQGRGIKMGKAKEAAAVAKAKAEDEEAA
jgi:hypothetical protein